MTALFLLALALLVAPSVLVRATLLAFRRRWYRAAEVLARLLRWSMLASDDGLWLMIRGTLLRESGRVEEAIRLLRERLERGPCSLQFVNRVVEVMITGGQYGEALVAAQAASADPEGPLWQRLLIEREGAGAEKRQSLATAQDMAC